MKSRQTPHMLNLLKVLTIMAFSRLHPYFYLSVLLFLIVPGVFIYQSIADLSYVPANVLLALSVSLCVLSILIFLILHSLLKLASKEHYLLAFASWLMFYAFIAGLLFPASVSSGLISLQDTPVNKT